MRYDDDATLITAVASGQVEIFATSPAIVKTMREKAPQRDIETKFVMQSFPLGIGMRKGEAKLQSWINEWVRRTPRTASSPRSTSASTVEVSQESCSTVICETPGTLRAEDRPMPLRGDDEVLLRVKRVGVCGTDLHIFTGNQPYLDYPRVMGHELSGIVERAARQPSRAPATRST